MGDDYLSPGLARWREVAIASLPLYLVNVAVLVAFAVDYFVELRLATDRRLYARKEWTSLVIVSSLRASPCCRSSRHSGCFASCARHAAGGHCSCWLASPTLAGAQWLREGCELRPVDGGADGSAAAS